MYLVWVLVFEIHLIMGVWLLIYDSGEGYDLDPFFFHLGNHLSDRFDGGGMGMTDPDGHPCGERKLDQSVQFFFDGFFFKGMVDKKGSLHGFEANEFRCLQTDSLRGGPTIEEEESPPL